MKIKMGAFVAGQEVRNRSTVIQQKTGRPVQFQLTGDVRASLLTWLERRGGTIDDYAFPSRIDHMTHASTRQYARLVDERISAIGLRRAENGTHSLRRTKASMIYKATGNLRACRFFSVVPRSRTRSAMLASTSGPSRCVLSEQKFDFEAVLEPVLGSLGCQETQCASPPAATAVPPRQRAAQHRFATVPSR